MRGHIYKPAFNSIIVLFCFFFLSILWCLVIGITCVLHPIHIVRTSICKVSIRELLSFDLAYCFLLKICSKASSVTIFPKVGDVCFPVPLYHIYIPSMSNYSIQQQILLLPHILMGFAVCDYGGSHLHVRGC